MTEADHSAASTAKDRWAAWLAVRRHGGAVESLRKTLEFLAPVRDRVVANALLSDGARVLDVGCGDGLVAFAALDAVGRSGEVIFSDVSTDLLDRCRELAARQMPSTAAVSVRPRATSPLSKTHPSTR